jgi:hypothetical protein
MTDLFLRRGARFSPCRRYRYRLWRIWDEAKPAGVYVMLNPSVADEHEDDNTITRCMRRAQRLGAGGIVVMNLFAWISPYPEDLYGVDDPVGPDTDVEMLDACRAAHHVVCGWGTHGTHRNRDREMLAMLRASGIRPMALGFNKGGSPKHPLYVRYDRPLVDFT